MSEPDTLPANVHPEVALLPWYANDTLPEQERETVMRHLASCADCRRELDELTQMKTQLAAVYRSQPEPSSRLARSVFAKVAREASGGRTVPRTSESWLDHLDRWFGSLFIQRWVPTLATMVITAQLGLLLWLTMPPAAPDEITTRSIDRPAIAFKVTFHEQATEKDIRSILVTIGGRIVDGPDDDHAYIVQASAVDSGVAEKTLELLRQRTDMVRAAEPLAR